MSDSAKLINLTPHDINFISDDGECYLTIAPTSPPARCEEQLVIALDSYITYENEHGWIKVPYNALSYANVYDLPEPAQATFYIVSVLVAQAKPARYDLLVPHGLVRDEQGRIKGCKRLVRVV